MLIHEGIQNDANTRVFWGSRYGQNLEQVPGAHTKTCCISFSLNFARLCWQEHFACDQISQTLVFYGSSNDGNSNTSAGAYSLGRNEYYILFKFVDN